MRIAPSAASLNVEDVLACSDLLAKQFGFHQEMAAVAFLRPGLKTLPDDLEGELARLQPEGVRITMAVLLYESGNPRTNANALAPPTPAYSQ
jgi:hypothetical protein